MLRIAAACRRCCRPGVIRLQLHRPQLGQQLARRLRLQLCSLKVKKRHRQSISLYPLIYLQVRRTLPFMRGARSAASASDITSRAQHPAFGVYSSPATLWVFRKRTCQPSLRGRQLCLVQQPVTPINQCRRSNLPVPRGISCGFSVGYSLYLQQCKRDCEEAGFCFGEVSKPHACREIHSLSIPALPLLYRRTSQKHHKRHQRPRHCRTSAAALSHQRRAAFQAAKCWRCGASAVSATLPGLCLTLHMPRRLQPVINCPDVARQGRQGGRCSLN